MRRYVPEHYWQVARYLRELAKNSRLEDIASTLNNATLFEMWSEYDGMSSATEQDEAFLDDLRDLRKDPS